jgi:hypothetical protein
MIPRSLVLGRCTVGCWYYLEFDLVGTGLRKTQSLLLILLRASLLASAPPSLIPDRLGLGRRAVSFARLSGLRTRFAAIVGILISSCRRRR